MMEAEKTALAIADFDDISFSNNLFVQYDINSRIFLALAYRAMNIGSDRLLKEQIEVCAKGYFAELYQLLGICKVPFSDVFSIYVVYQEALPLLTLTDFYFVDYHGFHWFEAEEDDFLELYDYVIEEQSVYNNLEEGLGDEFLEAVCQKDKTDTACGDLLCKYQIPPETEFCEKLVFALGYAFYSADEDEPQANMYVFRSRMLYELSKENTFSDIQRLFHILYDRGFVAFENAVYYANAQGYEDADWAINPECLYILCVLTQYGSQLSQNSRNIAEAIKEDASWFWEQKEREQNDRG